LTAALLIGLSLVAEAAAAPYAGDFPWRERHRSSAERTGSGRVDGSLEPRIELPEKSVAIGD